MADIDLADPAWRLKGDLRGLRAYHAFTRDRIGQPGCEVRKIAAEHVITIDLALAELARLQTVEAECARLRGALEPFVRHGRAAGAFGFDPDPIRFYTDTGYREVPVGDFYEARTALTAGRSYGE